MLYFEMNVSYLTLTNKQTSNIIMTHLYLPFCREDQWAFIFLGTNKLAIASVLSCGDVVDEDEEAAEDEDEEVDDAEEGTRNSDIKTRLYSLVSKQQVKFNQFIKQSDSCSRFFSLCLLSLFLCSAFFVLVPNWA